MTKLLPFFSLFIFSTILHAQTTAEKKDSIVITQPQRNEISRDVILHEASPPKNAVPNTENKNPYALSALDSIIRSDNNIPYDASVDRSVNRLSYSLQETDYNYGIGQFHQGGVSLLYKPLDKISIKLDANAIQYNILHSRYNDVISNLSIGYKFNNWLELFIFGQYAVNAENNARHGGYMLSPQTSYGTMVNFKLTDNIDLGLRQERVLNPMTRKWENNTVLAPAIRFK